MKKPCEGAALYEGDVVAPPFTVYTVRFFACTHSVKYVVIQIGKVAV